MINEYEKTNAIPHININEFALNQVYVGIYILKQRAIRTSSTNSQYIALTIADRTGEISGNLWNIPVGFNIEDFAEASFMYLKFEVVDFKGMKQIKLQGIRNVNEMDVFDQNTLIPIAPESPQKMYDEILGIISNLSNRHIKKLLAEILKEQYAPLMYMPAAKSMHHAFVGGLLYHMIRMLRLAQSLESVYPGLNNNLLYGGVILHDIGKIFEFVTGPLGLVTEYSLEGKLLNHLTMGSEYVSNMCKKYEVPKEEEMLLKHMILSHHGEGDYGSPVVPKFLEAYLLHMIDLIDSRTIMFQDAIKEVEPGTCSPKVFSLGNIEVYRPNL